MWQFCHTEKLLCKTMMLREIRIGRANDCDIFVDAYCRYASSYHAKIYSNGSQLIYEDTSSNGTVINNVKVHKRTVPIYPGDVILLAGHYQLSWESIFVYFPHLRYNGGAMPDAVSQVHDTTAPVETSGALHEPQNVQAGNDSSFYEKRNVEQPVSSEQCNNFEDEIPATVHEDSPTGIKLLWRKTWRLFASLAWFAAAGLMVYLIISFFTDGGRMKVGAFIAPIFFVWYGFKSFVNFWSYLFSSKDIL